MSAMWGIVGNERVVEALARGIAQGRFAHAHLFVGPQGVGKSTLALKLAQAINCTGETPPCGHCLQCRRTADGKHADVQRLQLGAGDEEEGPEHREIGIQRVKELQQAASLEPYEGRARVFIVDGADHLTGEAANRFLKTLEEPPDKVYIILLGRDLSRVLPTVVSRCRTYELRRVPAVRIEAALVAGGKVDGERARLLAGLSEGRPGWALSVAEDPRLLDARGEMLDDIAGLLHQGYSPRLIAAGRIAQDFGRRRDRVDDWLDLTRQWWRDMMLTKSGRAGLAVNADRVAALEADAGAVTIGEIAAALRQIERTDDYLKRNVNPRLALDVLMLSLPLIPSQSA